MEEIILKAKMGPPVSKLVNHQVVVTKELSSASLVKTHRNRRISGKQNLNTYMIKRELVAAVRHARKQTKREGKLTMKKVVDGIVSNANTQGTYSKAPIVAKINAMIYDLMDEGSGNDSEIATAQRVGKIMALIKSVEVIKQ